MLLLIFSSFYSCVKEQKFQLDESEKFLYPNGDTMVYKSIDNCDSFIVDKKFSWSTDPSISKAIRQRQNVEYENLKHLRADPSVDNEYMKMEVYRYNYGTRHFVTWNYSTQMVFNANFEKKAIHNVVIDSVYEAKLGEDFKNPKAIKKAYYTKQLGVIQYETLEGEVFTLEKDKLYEHAIALANRDSVLALQRELLTKMQDMRK